MFQLPYRGTEGFGRWEFNVMQNDLSIPGYTARYQRAKNPDIDLSICKKLGKIVVIVDSTGLKVYDEGECSDSRSGFEPLLVVRTHGKSKRPTRRKLPLMIDADTQKIVADVLTENSMHDSALLFGLIGLVFVTDRFRTREKQMNPKKLIVLNSLTTASLREIKQKTKKP